ncbi:his Kinase A domain protein [Desulfovibrio sp. A2]|nr:his Kinase A domain protein [Desulfovibrio sp. A2]
MPRDNAVVAPHAANEAASRSSGPSGQSGLAGLFGPSGSSGPSGNDGSNGRLPSPWLIIWSTVVLALVVAVLAVLNHDGEQEAMRRILSEKGASLIRAFEAGTRTGMRGRAGGDLRLQVLLEEMADQPDIHFIAVTDRQGVVLAHSDPEWIGRPLADPETMAALAVPSPPQRRRDGGPDKGQQGLPGGDAPDRREAADRPADRPADHEGQQPRDEVGWRLMDAGGERAFLVYRTFIPLRRTVRTMGMGGMGGMGGHMMDHGQRDAEHNGMAWGSLPGWLRREMEADMRAERDAPPPVIIVALDTAPFDAARAADRRHTLVMLSILALLGAAGALSLLWARHARASRRLVRQAQSFALHVVTSLPDGLVVLDGAGRVATCNAAARDLLRLGDSVPAGAAPASVLPPPLAELAGQLTGGAAQDGEDARPRFGEEVTLDCPVAGGPPVPMSVRGVRIATGGGDADAGAILILRDLREVRRLQDEVRRREKLAAIGSLAAGVAHELRNPLSSIKGYATYFGSRFAEGSEDREAARVMVQEVERLNRVISDLIGLARPSDIAPRPVDAGFLVRHVLRLVRQDAAHRGVTVRVEPDGMDGPDGVIGAGPQNGVERALPQGGVPRALPQRGVPRALLDPDRFSQALLNVFLNALEAMPHGGELAVRLAAVPGNRIAVSVRDTGSGIAPEHLATIFDPYFTTKSQGTGLGLAIVHKIVEAHGGEVSLRSASGQGTEVTFLLPAEPNAAGMPGMPDTPGTPDAPDTPDTPAGRTDDGTGGATPAAAPDASSSAAPARSGGPDRPDRPAKDETP